jgi:hypothetical protein
MAFGGAKGFGLEKILEAQLKLCRIAVVPGKATG